MPAEPDVKAWADELQRLLQLALDARQSGAAGRVPEVQQQLRQFCDDSPKFAQALDDVAMKASLDLDLALTEDAVAGIRSRAAEVQTLARLIAGVAASTQARARVLSGAPARQAIDAATSAIGAFKQLREQLDTADADMAAVAGTIDKTLAAVQALRNRLEKA
jgi:methyl-accepting chemotaxis protein